MTTETQTSSTPPSGGTQDLAGGESGDKGITREAFERLLSEKKQLQSKFTEQATKLDQLLAAQKTDEEKRLADQQQWKQLYEQTADRLKGAETKLSEVTGRIVDSRKVTAVLSKLGGEVRPELWHMIDVDDVAYDLAAEKVDDTSALKVAEKFKQMFPELIKPRNAAKLPNEESKGTSGKLSYDEWLKLPVKEQRARMRDIMGSV
jgi:hypothetical protein